MAVQHGRQLQCLPHHAVYAAPVRPLPCAGAPPQQLRVGLFVEYDFGGVLQIVQKDFFQFGHGVGIFDGDVQFAVGIPTRQVQVGAADPRPCAVDEGGFGVQHGAVPLEHAHARVQQLAVLRARHGAYPFDVGGARDEYPHVHAGGCGVYQCLRVHAGGHEVGIGNPQVVPRQADKVQIQPYGVGVVGRGGQHAGLNVAAGVKCAAFVVFQRGGQGFSLRGQGVGKGGHDVVHRRAVDAQAGVAPRGDAAVRVAFPGRRDA